MLPVLPPRRIRAKLRSNQAETLVEALCAILIVALSSLLLASAINAASRINMSVRQADREFRAQLSVAETYTTDAGDPAPTTAAVITLTGLDADPLHTTEVPVERYGDPDAGQLISYVYTPEGGETP